jgi:hypothetical protein
MTFKGLLLILIISSIQPVFAQDFNFDISTIPDSLKKNANSIVRIYSTDIEIESSKEMTIKTKKAITILNERGDHEAQIVVHYDKANQIKKLKVWAFNEFGQEENDISKNEFRDLSAFDGISLFNDSRLKYYRHVPTSYPYTIYYEYEINSSNTAFIEEWRPIDAYDQSLQESTFKISFPNDINIKKVEKNFDHFKILNKIQNNSIQYQIENVKAINHEELSPSLKNVTPLVKLASNKFRLENVDGIADNWTDFGKWMYDNLIASRMELPESTKIMINNLVKDIEDPLERAKIIYEFVQNKTRYISIQVGIGGWMPMLASDVDRLSYGDCKALTNYTKSLMDVAGVESYYTAVFAGNEKRSMENDVVSVQGNHVILNIPSNEKDIWLECTSQTVPFGYQGDFTDDRDVLVITPQGGKIKHTGIYNDKNNLQITKANYRVNNDASIEGDIKIITKGIQYNNHYPLEKKDEREINEHYKSNYWSYINNLDILTYRFENNRDSIIFHENLSISATDYAMLSGERMLFEINAFNKYSNVPKRYRNRKLPLEISRGFHDLDEYFITLPENYVIEALDNPVLIENKFGKYQFSIEKISDTELKYSRELFIKKGTYAKDEYRSYRDFRKKIAKNDNTKIVLIKK